MRITLDMPKLQELVYYLNNAKVSRARQDELHCAIVRGILTGEIDTEDFTSLPRLPEASSVLAFLRDWPEEGAWVSASSAYARYERWSLDNGLMPETLNAFCRALQAGGVPYQRRSDAKYYFLGKASGQEVEL